MATTFRELLDDFYPYAKKKLGFDKDAKIHFASDPNNGGKMLGKTAHYDPADYTVTIYTDNRHPKDIMRSISHELVHHAQNCRGEFANMSEDAGQPGYAQTNSHMREMEREAYEKGNMCFRDWEDGLKAKLEPGTIYESKSHLEEEHKYTIMSQKDLRNKKLNERLMESWGYKRPVKEDWQDDPMGGVSGEDSSEMDNLLRATIEDFVEMEGTSVQAMRGMALSRLVSKVLQHPGIEEAGHDELDVIQAIEDMQQETMMQEAEAGSYKAGDKVKDLRNDTVGTVVEPMAGGAVIELEDGTIVKTRDKFLEKVEGEPMNEARMGEYGKMDAEQGLPPTKIGRGNPEYMEAYNAVLIARGEEPLSIEEPDQAYLDALHSGNLEEYGDHETQARGGMVSSSYSSDPEMDQVTDIAATVVEQGGALMQIATALKDQGFSASLRSGVLMIDDKYFIGKPSKFDIGPDEPVQEAGPYVVGMMDNQMKEGVMKEEWTPEQSRDDVEYGGQIHLIPGVKFTGDIESDLASLPPEILDWMWGELESGDSIEDESGSQYAGGDVQDVIQVLDWEDRRVSEGFRGSEEEKEMMGKMSNKEFYDYVTRDRHTQPNLKGDMEPIPGMEGPFQFASGAVLYYDPKAGKYYDRGKDMYLDNEEASKLTMERKQMALREKVEKIVRKKLAEYGGYDDDPYADEDPYMAGLEAEFPWLKDKKKKKSRKALGDEDAAMAAAMADAEASGEFDVPPEEEDEDPTVMNETTDDAVWDMVQAVTDALGFEETAMNMYKAMNSREMMENLEYIARMMDIDIPQDEESRWDAYDAVNAAIGEEELVNSTIKAMSTEEATETLDFIARNYDIPTPSEDDMFEQKLRARVAKRLQELSKGQEELDLDDDGKIEPEDLAGLRAGKEDEDVGEEAEDDEKEDKNESIARTSGEFFDKLRTEKRTLSESWNKDSKSKRAAMLNERLMKAWLGKK